MRFRATLVALSIAAASALAAAGCGDDDTAEGGRSNPLSWDETPTLITPSTLPDDRILSGDVKNESLQKVRIEASDVKAVDADGKPLKTAATFITGYAHALWPYGRGPGGGRSRLPEEERQRLGQFVELQPGKSSPLTVSWREAAGRKADHVKYGRGTLAIEGAKAGGG